MIRYSLLTHRISRAPVCSSDFSRFLICRIALLSLLFFAVSATPLSLRDQVRRYREDHELGIVREFANLLSIPNVASDSENIQKNADHIREIMRQRGIQTKLLENGDAPPAVYGELKVENPKRTLGIYAHYDGQPVDASQWTDPPWTPVLRDGPVEKGGKVISVSDILPPLNPEWLIYARSAGDDKAPIEGILAAIDALRASKIPITSNLKFLFEGEEEAGSPHLGDLMRQNVDLLRADAWLFCDGPVHQSRRMQVYFGVRGVTGVEMTVYGPLRALHSGHYGNWAPNPISLLANLLAGMRDMNGKIKIGGFYDRVRPLTDSEKKAVAEVPDVDQELKNSLGLAWTESEGKRLVEAITELPAMNIRGIQGGKVGNQAANAIPTEATASIDFRLVPDLGPADVKTLVENHIREQGFTIVTEVPDLETRKSHPKIVKLKWETGYPASRVSMDLPVAQEIVRSIERTIGSPVIKIPSLGGSAPLYLFEEILKTPVIGVPIANHDDNQHAANENLRLQNLWDAIEIYAGLFAERGL